MSNEISTPSLGHDDSLNTMHNATNSRLKSMAEVAVDDDVVCQGALGMEEIRRLEEQQEQYYCGGPCMRWLKEQGEVKGGSAGDGLAFAQEFLDPRPDCGGWIRVGYNSDNLLCYSCNGFVRPPFKEVIFTISGVEAYLQFPELERGCVVPMTYHAAEVLLPSLRDTFDEAGVTHDIPGNDDLVLSVSPSSQLDGSAPLPPMVQRVQQDCNIQCSACLVM
eukprot:TRINITY_DN17646_c0_g1_i1.p1 TRINITY_DN17646_c0_g1~~TRINITY_DN17646_c0_g1_i1.p1  ORF type:complete len:220 (+),score=40.57 TRINITY_DN17646_c0_g1_i1:113-772(+)